jgi:hypothetical protein
MLQYNITGLKQLTNSTAQNLPCQADRYTISQELPTLIEFDVQHCAYKYPISEPFTEAAEFSLQL